MTDNFWAHTPPEGSERGHSLKEHLSDVAELARQLAKKFGAGGVGLLCWALARPGQVQS